MRLWFGYKSYEYLNNISSYYEKFNKGVWDTYSLHDMEDVSEVIPSNIDINNLFYELNVTASYIQYRTDMDKMNEYIQTYGCSLPEILDIIEELYNEAISKC